MVIKSVKFTHYLSFPEVKVTPNYFLVNFRDEITVWVWYIKWLIKPDIAKQHKKC